MKKKIILGIISMLLLSLCACGKKEELPETSSEIAQEKHYENVNIDECIEKILSSKTMGRYEYLDELDKIKSVDEDLFYKWREICDYWDMANNKDFVNVTVVPEELPKNNSLCIVVMGYQLNPDGSMREELIGRLETALNVANEYENAYVLVTGGGTAAENPSATEADCMAEWLIENGISKDRIIIENKSLTSTENALYSNTIIKNEYPWIENVVIVTSDYHVPLGSILYNTQFILAEDDDYSVRVISNSAFETNTKYFSIKTQADVIRNLYYRQGEQ